MPEGVERHERSCIRKRSVVLAKLESDMKCVIVLTLVLAGCGGTPSFYQYNHERQFNCDMDPNLQMCASPRDVSGHGEKR
ncbi:hypothetical protein PSEEN1986 [Pseudomonas entomophila L48]|uniref:Uncharacterized protein n=1 Tax=Pseudomonas entomophila (strain L48) TaxID=384676 RepID=Q1IBZ6_PSEE4|nr:hypothetical protein PSEEN1986 [Pseudomonas entomophila L48]